MTTPAPKRREQRRTHLDASVVPVERALLARAEVTGAELGYFRQAGRAAGVEDFKTLDAMAHAMAAVLKREYEQLAEELHWW